MSSFIATPEPSHAQLDQGVALHIEQSWWPDISAEDARAVLRLAGTVTNTRLVESLQNAVYSINSDLAAWAVLQRDLEPIELTDARLVDLYRRAVYFYAKAELTERYRDFDTTGAGEKRSENLNDSTDDARRIQRWAISDILGKSRLTVEAL